MAKLKFEQDDEGNILKNAMAMWSADGEYVDFNNACDCNGQVRNTNPFKRCSRNASVLCMYAYMIIIHYLFTLTSRFSVLYKNKHT